MVGSAQNRSDRNGWSAASRQWTGHWGWVVILGILLIAFGGSGIGLSLTAGPFPALGWFLLVSGLLQALHALSASPHRSFPLDLLASALYAVTGVVVVSDPTGGTRELAVLFGSVFMVQGLFRTISALVEPIAGRLYVFISGLVSLYLGIHLWLLSPTVELWLIGGFIGIDIAFTGWSLIMRGLGEKRLSREAGQASPEEQYP